MSKVINGITGQEFTRTITDDGCIEEPHQYCAIAPSGRGRTGVFPVKEKEIQIFTNIAIGISQMTGKQVEFHTTKGNEAIFGTLGWFAVKNPIIYEQNNQS